MVHLLCTQGVTQHSDATQKTGPQINLKYQRRDPFWDHGEVFVCREDHDDQMFVG